MLSRRRGRVSRWPKTTFPKVVSKLGETPQVSQPAPLGNGQTVVVPRTNIEVDDQAERRMGVLRGGVSLQELVRGLNALGVGPRDLISILQAIKAAGALQSELELR
jgi:flagellar P-ring protein FlgI